MSDLVYEAAESIVPLLSAGAGAAATDMVERGGARVSAGASEILAKLRRHLTGERTGREEVETALRSALAAGDLGEDDLKLLIQQGRGTVIQGGVHAERSVFIDSKIDVKGDFLA